MAKQTDKAPEAAGPPSFSDADKAKARQWFRKAVELRDQRNYDYAIEAIISGLAFWTEAVEEGHMPLWSLAIQRQQLGGKKPGMMDEMKKPISGKDAKQSLLNAELLLAKDPTSGKYVDALLKNAAKAYLPETLKWVAPKVLESLRRDKKPNLGRFKAYRENLVQAAERADAAGDAQTAAECYDSAVQAVEFLMGQNPGDMALRDEQRDLSGRLTIIRGKYSHADSFKESLQDAESQKRIHDSERMKQAESTLDGLIRAARSELAANPTVAGKVNALVDALLKTERKEDEDEAIAILTKNYADSNNYSFKLRADDILLRQLARQTRQMREAARVSGSADDAQQARLAAMEEAQSEIDIYRERIAKYPTDLRMKYRLGAACFRSGDFDEAIPLLQSAQADPRTRSRCQLLIGRAFFEKQNAEQACEVLRDALKEHEVLGDETGKELLFWHARSAEAAGLIDEAKDTYGKLLRQDYAYAEGEARQRLEALK